MLKQIYHEWAQPIYSDLKNVILDTLFPIHCLVCSREGNFICAVCKSQLTRLETQICIVCKKPSPFGITHSGCESPHGVDGLIAVLNYRDENVSNCIIQGKYSFLPGVFKELGELLAYTLAHEYPQFLGDDELWLVCPIPLSDSRKRWRGFNQSEVLCSTVSHHTGLITSELLTRTKNTKTQKDLKREQRISNVSNAFTLKQKSDVKNKNVILVDDVTTTGSTLFEATKVLKRNGAKSVWCLVLARD